MIRLNQFASLYIEEPKGFPPHICAVTREIVDLYTEAEGRRQGHATALLQAVCKEADEGGMALIVHVDPDPNETDLTPAGMRAWYEKHGFVVFQPDPLLMVRKARAH